MNTNQAETMHGELNGARLQFLPSFPEGAEVERLSFQPTAVNGQATESEFDEARYYLPSKNGEARVGKGLVLLKIPASDADASVILDQARAWVELTAQETSARPLLLTLQGAQVVWTPCWAVIVAQPDRMTLVRKAVIEFTFHEHELREIEQGIGKRWSDLESDSPLAFDFNEKAIRRREELGQRLQQTISLRARLARLTPHLCRPSLYPPTLASQIGERLRERVRAEERLDFVDGQLEVFERVYEQCGTRASEFMQSRKGHTLEMIIILLLATQVLFQLINIMAGAG